jgi:hypothetical protein
MIKSKSKYCDADIVIAAAFSENRELAERIARSEALPKLSAP